MRAVKTYAEVGSDKSLILKSLPFAPGSRVEVIVFPMEDGEDVFPTMDRIVKKKGIKPLKIKYSEEADILLITLRDGIPEDSIDLKEGVILHLGAARRECYDRQRCRPNLWG